MNTVERSLSVVPFAVSDADNIVPQEAQKNFRALFNYNTLQYLEDSGLSFTIVDSDNNIVSICGVLPVKDVGITWAVHADSFKQHAREITRTVKDFLNDLQSRGTFKVIKGSVIDGFDGGHKWMEILGFKRGGLHELGYHEYERIE